MRLEEVGAVKHLALACDSHVLIAATEHGAHGQHAVEQWSLLRHAGVAGQQLISCGGQCAAGERPHEASAGQILGHVGAAGRP